MKWRVDRKTLKYGSRLKEGWTCWRKMKSWEEMVNTCVGGAEEWEKGMRWVRKSLVGAFREVQFSRSRPNTGSK
ncbi:hypothetical protein LCGC14_0552140 [marine sediment metagenome]|uniref:Uncharacterized protein n=1 Tax=marine sediment metagenome TaxID=412755 RepID=A0A0F9UAV5_9ZZZZ